MDTNYVESGDSWYKQKLNGPDGHFWMEARYLFLFNRSYSSAINLFKINHDRLRDLRRPPGAIRDFKNCGWAMAHGAEEPSWSNDVKQAVRYLLHNIVTRWRPDYLRQKRVNINTLHKSLTSKERKEIPTTFDDSNNDDDDDDDDDLNFDVKIASEYYRDCFIPLHYHELWCELVKDYINVDTDKAARETIITEEYIEDEDEILDEYKASLIVGTNQTLFRDTYNPLLRKIGLFDCVLININNIDYFGIIVHVEETKVKRDDDNLRRNSNNHLMMNNNIKKNLLCVDIHTIVIVYVSEKCAEAFKTYHSVNKQLKMFKLSNITSSRRMISAIYNVESWPQYKSLLKPTLNDPYFHLPEQSDDDDGDVNNDNLLQNFNADQTQTIKIANDMFEDLFDRIHLVHGPPGTGKSKTIAGIVLKLLPKLGNKKILLCAPSNNACDELTRRILHQFDELEEDYKGKVVRLACQPPDDHRLCEHFLDFMVMATQSLEADSLLPFRFGCAKVIMVGDPQQLPPCVLSQAGKEYNLSQSLYLRLYSILNDVENINSPVSMLRVQYRMHPEICQWPSEFFYNNRLLTHPTIVTRLEEFPLKPLYFYNIAISQHEQDSASSSMNRTETSHIRKFCTHLILYLYNYEQLDQDDSTNSDTDSLSSSSSDDESVFLNLSDPIIIQIQQRIAVITPYRAQVRHLRSQLPNHIEIGTVDAFQGKEKDIVIISCVRSGGSIGFLEDSRRLNVMLTRSKYAMYLFGNFTKLSEQNREWNALIQNARGRNLFENIGFLAPKLPFK